MLGVKLMQEGKKSDFKDEHKDIPEVALHLASLIFGHDREVGT